MDLGAIPVLQDVYPWMRLETVPEAGLAQMFQKVDMLIPLIAAATHR